MKRIFIDIVKSMCHAPMIDDVILSVMLFLIAAAFARSLLNAILLGDVDPIEKSGVFSIIPHGKQSDEPVRFYISAAVKTILMIVPIGLLAGLWLFHSD